MGRRVLGRLVAVAAGGVLALAVAAPAYADSPIVIHPSHVPTTAEDFSTHECAPADDKMADKGDHEDGWHFLLPANVGSNFVSLTLTFDTPGGAETATIISRDDENPSAGPGWSGYIWATGAGAYRHAHLFTEAGWTLTAGAAVIEESADPTDRFNLSHTCPGEPGDGNGKTPPPTTPPPGNGETPPPGNGETPPPGEEPGLPVTGMQVGGLVALGVALLAAGAAMMVVRRRGSITDLAEEA